MNQWDQLKTGWRDLGKDVVLTGTGVSVILVQTFSAHPSGLLLGVGLALTVPSTWDHIKALLPSPGGESSSPPPQSPGSLPSSNSSSSPPPLPPGSSPGSEGE